MIHCMQTHTHNHIILMLFNYTHITVVMMGHLFMLTSHPIIILNNVKITCHLCYCNVLLSSIIQLYSAIFDYENTKSIITILMYLHRQGNETYPRVLCNFVYCTAPLMLLVLSWSCPLQLLFLSRWFTKWIFTKNTYICK